MSDICNQDTDLQYLSDFIDAWKNDSPEVGYNCIDGYKPNKINLLDFLNVLVQIKIGDRKVADWCSSCTTIQQTTNGYLTIKGALNLDTSTSDERPMYFRTADVSNLGDLSTVYLDVINNTWTDPTWPNIIVKSPAENIRVIDSNGNTIPPNTLKIMTVPIPDATIQDPTDVTLKKYYYLFVSVPTIWDPIVQIHQTPNGHWLKTMEHPIM